jgi:hypothetical protein
VSQSDATLLVAFGGREVAIRANDPAVVASLRATFRHLPGSGTPAPVAQVAIEKEGGRYRGTGPVGPPAHRATLRGAIRWARYQTLEAIIGAHEELLWLHGAVAGWRGRALMLPGRRGRGKSTMVTELCRRGWTFLTDDILPLDPVTMRVLPFPRVPEVRRDPGRDMPEEWLLETRKTEVPLDGRLQRDPLPVAAIVLPHAQRAGGVTLDPCTPAEAVIEIARGCWNFATHGERAVATLSRLVSRCPTMRLTFHSGQRAAARVAAWAARAWPEPHP